MITQQSKSFLLAGVLTALVLSGCSDEAFDESSETPAQQSDALEFQSNEQLYEWLVAEGARLGLSDVKINRNEEGKIASVGFGAESKKVLLEALQGSKGFFLLAGQKVTIPDSSRTGAPEPRVLAADDSGRATAALTGGIPDSASQCAGSTCMSGHSWNDHYTIAGFGYHDVGGSASASIATRYAATKVKQVCGTWRGAPLYCDTYVCNGGDTLFTVNRSLTPYQCLHTNGGSIGVTNTYFSNTSACGSGHCTTIAMPIGTWSASTNVSNNVSQSFSALGYFTLGCVNNYGPAECYVDGVCSYQYGALAGGSVSLRTASGSYDCP